MKSREQLQDELLVLRARDGEDGFNALFQRWQPAFLRHAMRLLHNHEDARDLVQECWCVILRRLDGLDDPAAFPCWAFRVITNRRRDWGRGQARRDHLHDRYKEMMTECVDPPAMEEGDPRLANALAQLTPNARLAIELFYEEEFTAAGIAEILGVPINTVKTRLHRARLELRRLMEVDQ